MLSNFSLEEFYLLPKRKVGTNLPWKRFLNFEYLDHENSRLFKLHEWLKSFRKTAKNSNVKEVSLYAIPSELSSSWKAAIAELGDFNFIGLSAFQSSPPIVLLGLVPRTIEYPEDYKLIKINKGKKQCLENKKLGVNDQVLIIEDWEYLPSDSIYLDIPYEKRIVQKLIKESLIPNDNISLCFQSPILSAPWVYGSVGGVSLSSISADYGFARELIKTINLTVPPEYRGCAPQKAYLGSKFDYLSGISFLLAERPYIDKNFLSGFCGFEYGSLQQEVLKRASFNGEYSIFSTLSPSYGDVTQIWKELMRNFTSTDITLPMELDDLSYGADLRKLRKSIDSDLWVQIAHARQLTPALDKKSEECSIKTINNLKEDFDVLLSDIYKKDLERQNIVGYMMYPIQHNVKRLVQSTARAEDRSVLVEKDFSKIRSLILDNFTGFIDSPKFEIIKFRLESKNQNLRKSIVESALINNPKLTINDLHESVKSTSLFDDIYDLQRFVDWLHQKGNLIKNIDKRYIWLWSKRG